jgi:hypothetical protein
VTGPTGPIGVAGSTGPTGPGFSAILDPAATRVLTASGTSTTAAQAQANLTFDGTTFDVSASAAKVRIFDLNAATRTPSLEFIRGSNSTFGGDIFTDWRLINTGGSLRFFRQDVDAIPNVGDAVIMKFNGNVGIGVADPLGILDVSGSIANPVFLRAPTYSRLAVQDVSTVNTVTLATSNSGLHYNIATSSFSNLTLPTTTTAEAGAFWVVRNNTGGTLNVSLTNNGNLPTPVFIPSSNSLTIAVSSNAINTFVLF